MPDDFPTLRGGNIGNRAGGRRGIWRVRRLPHVWTLTRRELTAARWYHRLLPFCTPRVA